jgi:hypothetical protein
MEVLPGEDEETVLLDIRGLQRTMAAAEASAPKRTAPRMAPATSLNDFFPSQEGLEPE